MANLTSTSIVFTGRFSAISKVLILSGINDDNITGLNLGLDGVTTLAINCSFIRSASRGLEEANLVELCRIHEISFILNSENTNSGFGEYIVFKNNIFSEEVFDLETFYCYKCDSSTHYRKGIITKKNKEVECEVCGEMIELYDECNDIEFVVNELNNFITGKCDLYDVIPGILSKLECYSNIKIKSSSISMINVVSEYIELYNDSKMFIKGPVIKDNLFEQSIKTDLSLEFLELVTEPRFKLMVEDLNVDLTISFYINNKLADITPIEIKQRKLKVFSIPMIWEVWDKIEVIAESLEEAIEYINDNINDISLGDEPEFQEGTYRIFDGHNDFITRAEMIKYLYNYWNYSGGIDGTETTNSVKGIKKY